MSNSKLGFREIIGQNRIKIHLLNLIKAGKLPHSLLISAVPGSGRKTLAKAIARYLLCENPDDSDACFSCPNCTYFNAATHPDCKIIAREDEKIIKVERLRQEVLSDINLPPQIASRKVYIIEGDSLNEQGQNALLKSLEEPPAYAYFILTIREADKLLPTVVSRVSEFKLEPLSDEEIRAVLKLHGHDEAADFLAAFSRGVPGTALDLATREDYMELRSLVLDILLELPQQNYLEMARGAHATLSDQKDQFADILRITQSYLADLSLVLRDSNTLKQRITNRDKISELERLASEIRFTTADAADAADAADSTKRVKASLSARINAAETHLREISEALFYNVNYEVLSWTFLCGLKECLNPLEKE